ncbi:tetratricopeptide repeat protein [Candidatus Sumerlaeota bacterium]|nr:tetratricopeptide repeat protein [Candidatus Sumerlaeota bacterium]
MARPTSWRHLSGEFAYPQTERPMGVLNRHLFPIVLVFLACLAFSTALTGDYCYDDIPTILDNEFIERWETTRALVSRDFGPVFGELSYRPIAPLTYFADAILFHKISFYSRLINLCLHLAVGLSLFGLWRVVFDRKGLAFAVSALFLVHPVVTETVDCSGFREDLLALLFTVWAIRALMRGIARGSLRWTGAAALLWFLALLSKEPAAMALLFAPLVLWKWQGRPDREKSSGRAPRLAAVGGLFFAAVFVLYVVLYLSFRPEQPRPDWPGGRGPFLAFLNSCRAFLLYLRLWMFPVGLSIDHPFAPSRSYADPRLWAGLFVLTAFALLCARLYVRENPPAGLGGLWICIGLVPVSQILPTPQVVAERYLYIPHAGMALLIASLVLGGKKTAANGPAAGQTAPSERPTRITKGELARWAVVAALLVVCVALTFRRNLDWRDDVTLNIRSYEIWNNAEGQAALGALYAGRGEEERARAIAYLREALASRPDLAPAHRALGILLVQEGEVEKARIHLEKAVELDPSDRLNLLALERFRRETTRAPTP